MYDSLMKQRSGDQASEEEQRCHSPNKLCKFVPVLQGGVTIKQGRVGSPDCRTGPLISCLDEPLQAPPAQDRGVWEETEEGEGSLAVENSTWVFRMEVRCAITCSIWCTAYPQTDV